MAIDMQIKTRLDAEGDTVTVSELQSWLEHIPPGATIHPVMRDVGSQRDPDEKFVGMVASWSETR